MIYAVPNAKAEAHLKLKGKAYVLATNASEAIAMACGEYLVKGEEATVAIGESEFLTSFDVITTLVQLYEIPVQLLVFARRDEPQFEATTRRVKTLARWCSIDNFILFLDPLYDNKRKRHPQYIK